MLYISVELNSKSYTFSEFEQFSIYIYRCFLIGATCGLPQIEPLIHHRVKRIVGGREATPHSWPWLVSMRVGDYDIYGICH